MQFTSAQLRYACVTLLAGIAVLAAAGCNKAPGEKLIPVAGKITVDGQPLRTGSVTFKPDGSQGNKSGHNPTGKIDDEGNYELSVPPERKGAPPGWYNVVIFGYDNPRPGHLKSFIDLKYQDEKTTGLKVEVVENAEPGHYDFTVAAFKRAGKQ